MNTVGLVEGKIRKYIQDQEANESIIPIVSERSSVMTIHSLT